MTSKIHLTDRDIFIAENPRTILSNILYNTDVNITVDPKIRKPKIYYQNLIYKLNKLSQLYNNNGEKLRSISFLRASDVLSQLVEFPSDPEDLKIYRGICKSTWDCIQEWLNTGEIQRLNKLESDFDHPIQFELEMEDTVETSKK